MILAPSPRPIPSKPQSQLKWLRKFLTEETPEDSSLDYKRGDSLHKIFKAHFNPAWLKGGCSSCGAKGITADWIMNDAKNELTKDVSGFANAGGGLLIYGIAEDSKRKSIPKEFAPVASTINPEDIFQILNSSIKPSIDGVTVKVIQLKKSDHPNGGCCVAIEIPKSSTAHQAKDKLYYRRYGPQTRAMENDEILDVMNRAVHPDVGCEIAMFTALDGQKKNLIDGVIRVGIFNPPQSIFCKNFHFSVVLPYSDNRSKNDEYLRYSNENGRQVQTRRGIGVGYEVTGENLYPGSVRNYYFDFKPSSIYLFMAAHQRQLPRQLMEGKILARIFADGMQKKEFSITVKQAEAHWDKLSRPVQDHWLLHE